MTGVIGPGVPGGTGVGMAETCDGIGRCEDFFYAQGLAYYSRMPAHYSNLLVKKSMIIVLNHNRGLYIVSQSMFLSLSKRIWKKNSLCCSR